MKMRSAVALAALSGCWVGCSGKPGEAPAPAVEVRFESGPLSPPADPAAGPAFDRTKPDVSAVHWVAGFHAQALSDAAGSEWHSDLRLVNGTRLLVATSRTPELTFPKGFALPFAQLLADTPEAWRGVELVSTTSGASGGRIQWQLDPYNGRGTPQRLYVLALALTEDAAEGAPAPSPGWTELAALPGSTWSVPPGPHVYRKQLTNVVMMDATVHAVVAAVGPHARALRLKDTTDGKTVWEAVVSAGARIEPFQSEEGFPIYRAHAYELEAEYENTESQPSAGSALVFLYFRVPGNGTLSYPMPPPEEAR